MGSNFKVKIGDKDFTPQEVSAFILQKVKRDAEVFLNDRITGAVITVPAYFNETQRQATRDAATIAGFRAMRIISDSTAAGLSFGLHKKTNEKILVFNIGGGSLDVTIFELEGGIFEVLSTNGDTQLGGSDMDRLIQEHILHEFRAREGIDLSQDSMAMMRLRETVEKARIELSTMATTDLGLQCIAHTPVGFKHLVMSLTRVQLEELIAPLITRCKLPIDYALRDANIERNDLDHIIMVGGPTRMPIVQNLLKEYFGKDPERVVDPMECVAMGAAIYAGILSGEVKDVVLLDVTPFTLGIETMGGVMTVLIPRNITIPTKKSQIFSTDSDNQATFPLHVLHGENPMAANNKTLGRFELVGILPAPQGKPQIDVTFAIDANGILHVSVRDLGNGRKEQAVTINSGLNKELIDRMVMEAEQYAFDDAKVMEDIKVRNQAESLLYQTEKRGREPCDEDPVDLKKAIEEKATNLRQAIESNNTDMIKKTADDLTDIVLETLS